MTVSVQFVSMFIRKEQKNQVHSKVKIDNPNLVEYVFNHT